jgi:hypothetical protein
VKAKIIVYTPNVKLGFRDLQSADLFNKLNYYYDVNWIFQNNIPQNINIDKKNIFILKTNKLRNYVWTLLFEIKNFNYNKFKLGSKQSFPFLGFNQHKIIFLKTIYKIKLTSFFQYLFEKYLDFSHKSQKKLFDNNSKVVVCFTSSKDLIFDDIVRDSEKFHKKVILVCVNWDNATSKPFIKNPDYIFTWGQQTADLAEKLHNIKSIPIGTPRFENYKFENKINIEHEMFRLGLKPDFKYILFAGVGFPFPEIETLNSLSDLLFKHNLLNYRIIYRPHPYAWKGNQVDFSDNFKKFIIIDPTLQAYKSTDLSQYRFLFSFIEGLITAYSTMLIESLINGTPLLLIAFEYEDGTKFDWVNAAKVAPHLSILKETNEILKCNNFNSLENKFLDLLSYNKQENYSESLKAISNKIVLNNELKYIQNLNLQLNKILKC